MNKRELPEIRIDFAYLLYRVSKRLHELPEFKAYEMENEADCEKWAKELRQAWQKYEEKILTGITQVLGLNFYLPVIDVYLAPYFIPQSDPVILYFIDDQNIFVDVLTHELIHVLLTDNNKVSIKNPDSSHQLAPIWEKMFGKHDFGTLVHIPVHAIHKHIYLDVLEEPSRFERDVERAKSLVNAEAYVKSWKYVNDHNYQEIIKKLRDSYED